MARVSRLQVVMKDIADKLIADDWFEMCSPDGSGSYYVIGASEYDADVRDDYTLVVTSKTRPGPMGEHVMRSQVAGHHRDYLKDARRRLERSGISASAIDRFMTDDKDALPELFSRFGQDPEPVLDFLEAFRISRGALDLDQKEEQQTDVVREKLCLREIIARFGKIVGRWERLERLPFEDEHLEEASRAYLYGFYRAAVTLSASSLEKHFRRLARVDWIDSYEDLITKAASAIGLGRTFQDQAKDVFRLRNKVVHEGHVPSHDESSEALFKARGLLAQILPS